MTSTAIQPVRADLGPVAASHGLREESLAQYLLDGDLGPLAPRERASLIVAICKHIGVDPIEQPFQLIRDGKGADARLVLYATKACTSALCRERGIDRVLVSTDINVVAGHAMVSAHARATVRATGRCDEATGVVPLVAEEWATGQNGKRFRTGSFVPLTPDAAANAIMKAQTKAKRRAVLDLVGLGVPDETEIEHGRRATIDYSTGEILDVEAEAKIEEGVSVEAMKAIDAGVDRLAALVCLSKGAVFIGLLRRLEITGVRVPVELTPAQGELVLEALAEEIELREQALEQGAGEARS